MWKLRGFLKPYWLYTLLAPLMMILEVCMDLSQPRLMAGIVNHGVAKGDLTTVWTTGVHMVVVALIGLIGGVGCTYFSTKAAQGFGADLRIRVFEKVQGFSFRQLDHFSTGSLITRLTGDVVQLLNVVQMLLRQSVREVSLIVGSLIMAVTISPRLSLILAVVIPIQFAILYTLMKRSTPLFRTMQRKLDRVNTVLQESMTGIRVIKAFVRGAFERARFGRANDEYYDSGLKSARALASNGPLMTLILNMSIACVLWLGAGQTWSHAMPIGDLAAFLIYLTQVLFSLVSVSNTLMNLSRARVSADRIHEVLGTEADMNEPLEAVQGQFIEAEFPDSAQSLGRLDFERVTFAYPSAPNTPVLHEISFTAFPGQTIGILGATGSGKSTLVSLIPRLYDADAGRILIDGVDVRDMPVDQLRGQIGIVLQQSMLFSGTIRDNIRFGRSDAAELEVRTAARAAEAHEFIDRLPNGYDSRLGQRGVNLSGGQKQRIAIARALLVRSRILLLDDSTSAIDLVTEKRIQRSLRELLKNSTCIVIAQRITSVMHADQIIVLDQGRIAAKGTHEELLSGSSIYRDIYESQHGKESVRHG